MLRNCARWPRRIRIALAAAQDVCFEWPMEPLDRDRVLQAMRKSLAVPDARIEIAETSLNPVPRAASNFRAHARDAGLAGAGDAAVLWRGDVVYGDDAASPSGRGCGSRCPASGLIAAEAPETPGEPIEARQMRVEPAECFPGPGADRRDRRHSVVGMVPAAAHRGRHRNPRRNCWPRRTTSIAAMRSRSKSAAARRVWR